MQLMALRGPSCEESNVAQAIIDKCKSIGVPADAIQFDTAHKRTPRPGEIGNLIVKLPGTRKGPRLMLSAHMDAVPLCTDCKPKRTGNIISQRTPRRHSVVMTARVLQPSFLAFQKCLPAAADYGR